MLHRWVYGSVRECTATGFVFENAWPELLAYLLRALLLCRDRGTWHQVRSQAVQRGFGWAASAVRYLELYRVLLTDGCSR